MKRGAKKVEAIGAETSGPPVFSTGDVAAHLGIAPYDLHYWIKIGLLTVNGESRAGRGGHLLFGIDDLRVACLIRRLDAAKVKPQQIKGILAEVRRVQDDPTALENPLLIPFGATYLILQRAASGNTLIMDASRPGQYVMTIVLETIEEEVRGILARTK